jgi:hypothetical protein
VGVARGEPVTLSLDEEKLIGGTMPASTAPPGREGQAHWRSPG